MSIDQEPSETELEELSEFIEEQTSSSLMRAVGLFAAVATAPSTIEPGEWMDALWGAPRFRDEEQAGRIIRTTVAVYNSIAGRLERGAFGFVPPDDSPKLIEHFCIGYLEGVQLDAAWKSDERGMVLPFIFAVLAGRVPADEAATEDVQDTDAWLAEHRQALPEYVAALYHRYVDDRLH